MRLSTAIRLGSLAIQNPRKSDITSCAIGMACEAIGKAERDSLENYTVLATEWPWTESGRPIPYYQRITTLFDAAVCSRAMTIEALCDQVRMWEEELAAKGIDVEQSSVGVELPASAGGNSVSVGDDSLASTEQVSMAAELNQPAGQIQSIQKEVEHV